MVVHPLIPVSGRHADLRELQASPLYIVNSRLVRATQRDTVFKKITGQRNNPAGKKNLPCKPDDLLDPQTAHKGGKRKPAPKLSSPATHCGISMPTFARANGKHNK